MVHILSSQRRQAAIGKVIAHLYPVFGAGEATLFWAEGGMVAFEDRRPSTPVDKRCGFLDWDEAARRTLVLSQMVIRSSEDPRWSFERRRLQKYVMEMEEVIREAKAQEATLLHERKSRRNQSEPRRRGAIPVAFEANEMEMLQAAFRDVPIIAPNCRFDGPIVPAGTSMDF